MSTHRRLITTATLTLLVAYCAVPASTWAGSLLSGYGGPGQGNQAILGAALVNGPGGGEGGGGGGSGAGGTLTSTPAVAGTPASGTPAAGATGRANTSGRGHGGRARASVPSSRAETPRFRQLAYGATAASPALGVPSGDLLYILLGFAGLALTGALTRQLVRRPR
jgi:hypothetical protein